MERLDRLIAASEKSGLSLDFLEFVTRPLDSACEAAVLARIDAYVDRPTSTAIFSEPDIPPTISAALSAKQ